MISLQYRALNASLHESEPEYGVSGRMFGRLVREILRGDPGIKTALDYGCGKGTLKTAVPGVEWQEYDPAVPGKDIPPRIADLVCCTEVLEHVEPEYLDSVLDHLRQLTGRLCFMTVSFGPALKVLADGRNAHLIQQPETWWDEQIGKRFTLIHYETRQHEDAMMLLGIPRRGV